jgi:hypothetical protein
MLSAISAALPNVFHNILPVNFCNSNHYDLWVILPKNARERTISGERRGQMTTPNAIFYDR